MKLVYISLTGNVERFVKHTGLDNISIDDNLPFKEVLEDYVLVIPSYEGELINGIADAFINYKNNKQYLKGIAASGNRNFGDDYCLNGKHLSQKYSRPLILMFEFSGTSQDLVRFKKEVENIEVTRTE
ncbi:class Ib ribonucleoside-diphosphate reductase assembly flavoprotein NrdI [Cytobacillus kochii]|uniref:class Ib ribonucleoside-diphosphate reductase assembly flavoprotein NrdI n=1 Tax=Cytobacillus kochii TaxID=859143 RepID=UPI001CD6DA8C|nr:class Ib ribonucleoside-diphosphate reductase assembly flavoprotein NrdI [Cytobacillus kochii]MCA1027064.1 class Ib ribonucleoside-diphosphate reductase assembly flavoprotein NrdI [Cytobacillus kochii]